MAKKQSSLDAFLPDEKEKKEKPKAEKEKIDAKSAAETSQIAKNDNDVIDEFDKTQDEDEDVIFEGAPVEHCPINTPPLCLLQSVYDGKSGKAFLYLLDEHSNKLYGWYDNTNHQPYCLSDLSETELKQISPIKNFSKITGYESLKLRNLLTDKDVRMTKISVTDPLAIAGGFDSLRDKLPTAWEANIRYHQNYLYDRLLVPGMYYQIKEGNLEPAFPKIEKVVEKQVLELFKDSPKEVTELIPQYLPLLLTRIPHIKRAAIDIEVYTPDMTHLVDPKKANEKIISVAFAGNDGLKKVFTLKRDDVPLGTRSKNLSEDVEIQFFDDEVELIRETFKLMQTYPVIITFNGDNYDLPYLFNRAELLKINRKENPILVVRDSCKIRNSIHFDAYRFFNQAAIKVYAFGSKYSESSLDAISGALLESNKIKLDKDIGFLDCYTLAEYNFIDSKLTLELTTFNDSVTMR
ncbi:MAG: type B DNA-directed DNA polymerase, partial [Candidatus Heimdallarchaeota archaeon]|nr:type B DNA-directed DNA polymerase [Candidatus Heimdallarchaeota archaeon]